MNTLHYIFDPLCGWCYAAAPLISAARKLPGLAIAFHGGGMLTGSRRQTITPQWRDYVMPHDRRIAQMTGQPFGEAYFEGLLRDTSAVMDSAPPTTAILAAEDIAGRGLDMIQALQHAHYADGRRIADRPVLDAIAAELGLDVAGFAAAFDRLAGEPTERHFRESIGWLGRAGGQGFPTLLLEDASGRFSRIDIGRFLGQPEAFAAALREQLPASDDEVMPHCGLDGCTDH
ncbi:DsbA family protein [Uliginosibacterium paludis]|uniref:DsbA family protein n=1 Tax=Uliginosibacterium paludis TaxID=1615952 RepID=A0ABV2CSV2_9RHOO